MDQSRVTKTIHVPAVGKMKDQHTTRMWSVFDETGIFMAVCRHGFSLVIADMVRSGER